MEEVLCPVEKNLSVIYTGYMEKPQEDAVFYRQADALLKEMRQAFDVVILDTPPASLLVEAGDLAALADDVLMVVRQNHASRSQIRCAAESLTDSGTPLLGTILNYAES